MGSIPPRGCEWAHGPLGYESTQIVDSTNDDSGRNTLIGYDNSEMPSFSAAITSVDDDED